jgi:hypothetical protein
MKHIFLFLLASLAFVHARAQKMSEADVAALVDGGSYFFRAQQMMPTGARSRMLTELYYTLQVRPDTLSADLPYVGRVYQASVNPTDAGVKFTSRDFTVERKTTKKGNTEIHFFPKDEPDAREAILTVYTNGNANLMFTFNRRQNISYQGIVLPLSELK